MWLRLVVIAALALPCVRAFAQFEEYRPRDEAGANSSRASEKKADIGPVSVRAGGIVVLPTGETSERFDPGGGFAAGITFFGDTPVGLQLDYVYSRYGVRDDALELLSLRGHHSLQGFNVGLTVRPTLGTRFGFYVVAGPGVYHRDVTITYSHAAGGGDARYCDALLFFCFPTEVPASETIGSESSIDFGVQGGVGVYLMAAAPLRVYLEARYHYVWGPTFRTFSGATVDSDAGYLPMVLGVAY